MASAADVIRLRAALLAKLRAFFAKHGFLEVDTPIAHWEAIPERTIDLFAIDAGKHLYLQASPEMAMKQLLCAGSGPIYQIGKVFRREEQGRLHNSEFTMVEWYRPGDSMQQGIDLLHELVRAVAPQTTFTQTNYRDAFLRTLAIDPHLATLEELQECCNEHKIVVPSSDDDHAAWQDRDEWLNLLLATKVEPTLGQQGPEVLFHYPASQSALACLATDEHGTLVAERFELYWKGIELANGYHELTDAQELRDRLEIVNKQRQADSKSPIPLPERLLNAIQNPGMPPTTGVALGFDRLAMVLSGAESVADVLP